MTGLGMGSTMSTRPAAARPGQAGRAAAVPGRRRRPCRHPCSDDAARDGRGERAGEGWRAAELVEEGRDEMSWTAPGRQLKRRQRCGGSTGDGARVPQGFRARRSRNVVSLLSRVGRAGRVGRVGRVAGRVQSQDCSRRRRCLGGASLAASAPRQRVARRRCKAPRGSSRGCS